MSYSSPYHSIHMQESRALKKAWKEEREKEQKYSDLIFNQRGVKGDPSPVVNLGVAVYNKLPDGNPQIDWNRNINENNRKETLLVAR
jgi:hypothetical protein